MLHNFLATHRIALIDRCRLKVTSRSEPKATDEELMHGIPIFLDQLIRALRIEQTVGPMPSCAVSGAPAGDGAAEIGVTAALHGRELLKRGFTLEQVVRDYGDLCQVTMDLACELGATIDVDEFRTFNRCLDNAIAEAVTEYAHASGSAAADQSVHALNARLGPLAHELRDLVHTATLAVHAMKAGKVGLTGATGAVLDRCLLGMRHRIDRSLAEVRVTTGLPARQQLMSVAAFVAEAKVAGSLEARARACKFTVTNVDESLAVYADREMLFSAVGNLLQNAFKFTTPHSEVSLRAHAAGDRILVEVEDHCGGLPTGGIESMFLPFNQNCDDRSGLGLGLDMCRRSVAANQGLLRVRDKPGAGCVFTIDLPRHVLAGSTTAIPRHRDAQTELNDDTAFRRRAAN
jgi:signal transduction histidine kinase